MLKGHGVYGLHETNIACLVTVVIPVSAGLALQYNGLHRMKTRVQRLILVGIIIPELIIFFMRVIVRTLTRR